MKKDRLKLKLLGIGGLLLAVALLFAACPGTAPDDEEIEDPVDGSKSAAPVITGHPASGFYAAGETIKALTVTATGGGTLTYQWFEGISYTNNMQGTPIPDATAATYTPTVSAAGDYYYFAAITHTEGEKTATVSHSNSALIKITAAGSSVFNTEGRTLTFNPGTEYQYVRGFGGMLNTWTSPDMVLKDIDTAFSPDGLGFNMLRICLYPYTDNLFNGEEAGDPEVGNKKTHGDYYQMVKRVNQYGGYVLASPWTPPAEFKTNGAREDGKLLPNYYPNYAQHLRDFCKRMADNGAPIYAVSIQNEPNWEGGYDGCLWTPNEMRDFFKQVGHFTTVPTPIPGWGGGQAQPHVLTMNGESANNPAINDAALNDPQSAAAIDIIGRHIYGERTTKYTKGLDMGYEVWMTEINTNAGNATGYPSDSKWPAVWTFINDVHNCINNNNESAFIHWYIKRFYGLIGDGQYTTAMGEPQYRGYALSQFAKFASDTTRIQVTASGGVSINTSTAVDTNLKVTAYKGMDGNSLSMVILNPTGSTIGDVEIKLPEGFTATGAYGMKTSEASKGVSEPVFLNGAGTSGFITLPASTIISVRFTK
jgi:O-glycosyl hydrolase